MNRQSQPPTRFPVRSSPLVGNHSWWLDHWKFSNKRGNKKKRKKKKPSHPQWRGECKLWMDQNRNLNLILGRNPAISDISNDEAPSQLCFPRPPSRFLVLAHATRMAVWVFSGHHRRVSCRHRRRIQPPSRVRVGGRPRWMNRGQMILFFFAKNLIRCDLYALLFGKSI